MKTQLLTFRDGRDRRRYVAASSVIVVSLGILVSWVAVVPGAVMVVAIALLVPSAERVALPAGDS